MSRFFTQGDSSSESESSDEEELYSDEEVTPKAEEKSSEEEGDEDGDGGEGEDSDEDAPKGANKFLKSDDDESEQESDEDAPKVVKSAKSKRLEELEGVIKAIHNAKKIGDWSVISNGRLHLGV